MHQQILCTKVTAAIHKHVYSSVFSQCCEQLARAQADLQVTIRDLEKSRKTYQEAEQTAQTVREKADMEAKYVCWPVTCEGSDISCPQEQGRGLSCFSVLNEDSYIFAVFPYSCFFVSGIFLLFLFTCAIQGQSSVCFSHAPVWRGRVWRYNAQYISIILVYLLIFNI